MKTKLLHILLLNFLFLSTGHSQVKKEILFQDLPEENRKEVNTLLTEMFEGVGLYTLLGDFKPMSTVKIESLSVYLEEVNLLDRDGNLVISKVIVMPKTKQEADTYQKKVLETIEHYSRLFEKMNNELFYFQFMPLKTQDKILNTIPGDTFKVTHIPEILILRKDLCLNIIKEKESFFNSIKVDTIDFVEQFKELLFDTNHQSSSLSGSEYDRAYGYLFGFPDYAVDFFTDSQSMDNHFAVKRKPVSIPVYGKGSSYVYIIPNEGQFRKEDELLQEKAGIILEKYKTKRLDYVNGGEFDASGFIQDWFNNN